MSALTSTTSPPPAPAVMLAPAPIFFGPVSVTSGRARQPVPIPAGLAPAAVFFQWVELDPVTSVPVKLSARGAERIYEIELSAAEKEAFTKAVAANTELMNIAKGFLS